MDEIVMDPEISNINDNLPNTEKGVMKEGTFQENQNSRYLDKDKLDLVFKIGLIIFFLSLAAFVIFIISKFSL